MLLNSGHSPGKLIDTRRPSEVLRQKEKDNCNHVIQRQDSP